MRGIPPYIRPGERVVIFDATCKLCIGWVNFLIRHDRHQTVRMAAVQSEKGKALFAWSGLPTDNINTIVLIDKGDVLLRSEAIFRAMSGLPCRGAGWACCVFSRNPSVTCATTALPLTATVYLAATTPYKNWKPTTTNVFWIRNLGSAAG